MLTAGIAQQDTERLINVVPPGKGTMWLSSTQPYVFERLEPPSGLNLTSFLRVRFY